MEKSSKNLNGLASKIEKLLKEYDIKHREIALIRFKQVEDISFKITGDVDCWLERDFDTGELIWVCE